MTEERTAAAAQDAGLAERLAFVAGSLNRRLRPPADALTHVALSALASIERSGEIRPGDLARIEGIAAPGMTRRVADLEGRRSQLIRLTPDGVAAVAEGRQARATGVASILQEVPAEELPTLERAVGVLEAALLSAAPAPSRTL